jgi:hypothetical protein
MKPSMSALVGAIVIGGGWVSMPAVAFASDMRPGIAASMPLQAKSAAGGAARDASAACGRHTHTHSSTCTCARCSSVAAE